MSYAEDFEDTGGILAEQDYFAEDCENYDGECSECPHKYQCWSSTYNENRRRHNGC